MYLVVLMVGVFAIFLFGFGKIVKLIYKKYCWSNNRLGEDEGLEQKFSVVVINKLGYVEMATLRKISSKGTNVIVLTEGRRIGDSPTYLKFVRGIRLEDGFGNVEFYDINMDCLRSLLKIVEIVQLKARALDSIVFLCSKEANNYQIVTSDGNEEVLQQNVLAPALLVCCFSQELIRGNGCVIFNSSPMAYYTNPFDPTDCGFLDVPYSPAQVYRVAKYLNAVYASHLAQKYPSIKFLVVYQGVNGDVRQVRAARSKYSWATYMKDRLSHLLSRRGFQIVGRYTVHYILAYIFSSELRNAQCAGVEECIEPPSPISAEEREMAINYIDAILLPFQNLNANSSIRPDLKEPEPKRSPASTERRRVVFLCGEDEVEESSQHGDAEANPLLGNRTAEGATVIEIEDEITVESEEAAEECLESTTLLPAEQQEQNTC